MKTNGMLYTVIFTFLAAFLFVLLLALANNATRETITRNETLARQKALLTAGGIPFADDQEALDLYLERVRDSGEMQNLYILRDNTGSTLYGLIFSGPGLWGTITGILAVDEKLTEIRGIEIVSHNETPGLGGKIDEAYFKAQFTGEKLNKGRQIDIGTGGPGDSDHSNSRVDGISGATRTSELFEILINKSLAELNGIIGGSK